MEKHQPKDASELKGKTGLRRLMNATKYSAQGFRGAWQTEEAFLPRGHSGLCHAPYRRPSSGDNH